MATQHFAMRNQKHFFHPSSNILLPFFPYFKREHFIFPLPFQNQTQNPTSREMESNSSRPSQRNEMFLLKRLKTQLLLLINVLILPLVSHSRQLSNLILF